ncbi:MAG: DUF1501 domain-containing protein [Bacteroidota bacterium]
MKRRDFFKISTPLALSPFLLNGIPLNAFATPGLLRAMDCTGISERVLVLVQLRGGNDGLNTIIPIDQYSTYANLRPTIAIPDTGTESYINLDNTLAVEDQIGLHPSLAPLQSMYDDGLMNVLQGVGYQDMNRSHFKATDLWFSGGDSTPVNNNIPTGWIGRYLDHTYPGLAGNPNPFMPDPLGIQLGDPKPSLGFHTEGEHATSINLSGQDPAGFFNLVSEIGGLPIDNVPASHYGEELQYIMNTEQSVSQYSERITNVFNAGTNAKTYPDLRLAAQLKTVARLISGGSQTRIFLATIGGFDTHILQVEFGTPTVGDHANLMAEVAQSIKAFHEDLDALGLGERVMTVTLSEFGRKATENANFGTDHGSLAPMFVFGKGVKGGVSGTNVDLSNLGPNDQLQGVQYDYRQVFTSLLQDWLGASDDALVATKFDPFVSQKIPLVSPNHVVDPDCYISVLTSNDSELVESAHLELYPNPASHRATLAFDLERPQTATLSIYTIEGQVVHSQLHQLMTGYNEIEFDVSRLATGAYFVKLMGEEAEAKGVRKLIVERR